MKGLLYLAGFDVFEVVFNLNKDINWDNPNWGGGESAVLAQCMIVASIAPGWKRDERWRAQSLHANPARLWKFLEKNHSNILSGGSV